jgi:DNA-binding beta-propeller fold protein YncE
VTLGLVTLTNVIVGRSEGGIKHMNRRAKFHSQVAVGLIACCAVLVIVMRLEHANQVVHAEGGGISARVVPTADVGLVYVVDAGDGWFSTRVLAVDPSQGKIVRTYQAGYRPDIALSPDGSRLYLDSKWLNVGDVLEIYDTASGQRLAKVSNPDSMRSTVPVYATRMTMSHSGKYLYMVKAHNTLDTTDVYLSAFDTERDQFLPAHVSLYGCSAVLLPLREDLKLDVACSNSPNLREIILGNSEDPKEENVLGNERILHDRWNAVFVTQDERKIGLIGTDTSSFLLDRASRIFSPAGKNWLLGKHMGLQRALVATNGNVFLGDSEGAGRDFVERYDQVVMTDTSLTPGERFSTVPFFSMALSHDGNMLYTISPAKAVITVIDTSTLRELRHFSVGTEPIFAIAAP